MARGIHVIGNWKMHGRRETAIALARMIRDRAPQSGLGLVLCPPAPLLAPLHAVLAGSAIGLGGQDCHAAMSGAFTGDIAAEMLADAGCTHVIVGHSERRMLHGEADAAVRAKAEAAHRAGLTAILCVGETLAEREAGRTETVLAAQIRASLPQGAAAGNLLVAYEPVWAIGTGRVASAAQVAAAHACLRAELATLCQDGAAIGLLYGGSVKPENASGLFALEDVDGALVGGASLDADQFLAIAAAALDSRPLSV